MALVARNKNIIKSNDMLLKAEISWMKDQQHDKQC